MHGSGWLALTSSVVLAASIDAAVSFENSFSSGGGGVRSVVRVIGSVEGLRSSPPTGSVDVEAQLEPGVFTLISLNYDVPDLNLVFSGSPEFIDPSTFVSSTYEITILIGRITGSFSAGSADLVAGSGGLDFDASSTLSGLMTLSGSYSIVGPSSTVESPFSVDLPVSPASRLRGTLANIDYPNSFDLYLDPVGFRPAGPDGPVEIFNETVDGNTLSSEIFLADLLTLGAVSLAAVPEPSVPLCLGFGAVALLVRRRRVQAGS